MSKRNTAPDAFSQLRAIDSATYADSVDEFDKFLLSIPMQAHNSIEQVIVQKSGDVVAFGNFEVSAVGLSIKADISEKEWLAFIAGISRIQSALQWIIGDLIAYGVTSLNKTYEELSEIFGYKPSTLAEWVRVCRQFKLNSRHAGHVKFGHHQVVAHLTPPVRENWLEMVDEKKISVARLRVLVEGTPEPVQSPLANKVNRAAFNRIWRSIKNGGTEIKRADVERVEKWLEQIKRSKTIID